MIRPVLLLIFTAATYGQIIAPQLGLIPDGGALRPVAGIPAAAAIGSPIPATRNLSQTIIAPTQTFALSFDANTGEVLVVTSGGVATPIPGIGPTPSLIQFSPQGSAVVLLYPATSQATIILGLPGIPTLRDVDLSFIDFAPTTLAVSDDGMFLAGGWPGIVYQFAPTGIAGLPVNSNAPALAFSPGTSDLALVSTIGATLWTSAGTSTLASFPNTLNPIGASLNSRRLVVADSSGAILMLDRTSGALTSVNCGCTPQGLFPLNQSAYRLTSLTAASFRLFDANQNAVWFAPLALQATAGGPQ
jgi:hypothetical protein